MSFDKIKNKLGFGAMRLKMNDTQVDYEEFNAMIDAFMGAGFNYFDTAHGYLDGKSEIAIGACLSSRYNREDFVLANKLSEWFVKSEEEVIPFFEKQLETCGVEYFDFYLCHAMSADNYDKYKSVNAFGVLQELKNPEIILKEITRIGKRGLVGFINFGHIRNRLQLFLTGRMPRSKTLPHDWYNTPNIHLGTIRDFRLLCEDLDIEIIRSFPIGRSRSYLDVKLPNLLAHACIFEIRDRKK